MPLIVPIAFYGLKPPWRFPRRGVANVPDGGNMIQTEAGEIPENWMAMTLTDAATVVGGGTPKRSEPGYWNGDVPWATPTDVTGLSGRIISETASSITEAGLASSAATLLPPNSLLMTTRATIGACAINRVTMATNQGFQNLVPKRPTMSVDFLYYLITYHAKRLEQLAAGSTFLEISKRTVRSFEFICPPISEQRKIAAILSSVDDAIEKTQAVIDQAQFVKRGLMQVLLTCGLRDDIRRTEPVEIPDGWERKTIAEIGKVVTGSTPSTSNHTFWNGVIPFVTPTDLGRAKRVSTTGRHVSEDGLAQVREIPPGSVMVTCIGTSIGKIGMAVERCCTNQQINSVITGDAILSEYLYYALSFASGALVGLAGITAVPIVSKSTFLTCGVLVPPLAEQEQIVQVLSSVDHVIEVNQKRMAKLTEAKRGLMSLLLSGELRVTPDTDAA